VHGLFAAGGEDGTLECFDLRARAAAGRLDAAAAAGAPGEALTAVRFDGAGMQAAVGTSNGLVAIFDLRSSRPLLVKDHMYGDPIRDIKWHVSGAGGAGGALAARRVVSSDCHAVKVGAGGRGRVLHCAGPCGQPYRDLQRCALDPCVVRGSRASCDVPIRPCMLPPPGPPLPSATSSTLACWPAARPHPSTLHTPRLQTTPILFPASFVSCLSPASTTPLTHSLHT
jgi:hypothetical protein